MSPNTNFLSRTWRPRIYAVRSEASDLVRAAKRDDGGGFDRVLDARKLSAWQFRRTDLEIICTILILLSTSWSIAVLVIGCKIVTHLQPMPEFLYNVYVVRVFFATPNLAEPDWVYRHYAFASSRMAFWLATVATNVILTAFLDAHAKVASVASLWLLEAEDNGKPKYNTNSRLLTTTKAFGKDTCETHHDQLLIWTQKGPCHWTVNIITALTIALSYGGAATIFWQLEILGSFDEEGNYLEGVRPGSRWGVDVAGVPVIMLGGSVLVQSLISIWSLILIRTRRAKVVKTFSSVVLSAGEGAAKKAPDKGKLWYRLASRSRSLLR